jgi:chromosome segregation ATPase
VVRTGEDPDSYQAYGYYTTDHDGVAFSFGLMTGGTQNFSGSLTDDDGDAMEKVRAKEQGRFLWFRLAGKNYVVHDPQALDQVREIMQPQEELGRRQGALGDQQSRLGDKQSDLGERQSKLGEEQSRISERASDLSAKLSEGDLTRAQRDALEREIDDLRARQVALSDAQSQLGELQSQLGVDQSDLGRKQSELGRLQSEASVTLQRQMRELAGKLVKDGRARAVEI